MFVIILMIPFKIKEASLVAELTKDIAMKITFNDKNSAQENMEIYMDTYLIIQCGLQMFYYIVIIKIELCLLIHF